MSQGTLILRNMYVASSDYSCPTNSMLNLRGNAIIYCPLGLWVPPLPFVLPPMNFIGCPYPCAPGHFGNTSQEKDATCSGECDGGGQYCLPATAQPLLCPAGTYLPVGVAGLVEASCIPCAPGAYNPHEGGTRCLMCPTGKLSESVNSTECSNCPHGGFCSADGAASLRQTFTPCSAGTFNPEGGQSSSASCLACAPGKAIRFLGAPARPVVEIALPASLRPPRALPSVTGAPLASTRPTRASRRASPANPVHTALRVLAQRCRARRARTPSPSASPAPTGARRRTRATLRRRAALSRQLAAPAQSSPSPGRAGATSARPASTRPTRASNPARRVAPATTRRTFYPVSRARLERTALRARSLAPRALSAPPPRAMVP